MSGIYLLKLFAIFFCKWNNLLIIDFFTIVVIIQFFYITILFYFVFKKIPRVSHLIKLKFDLRLFLLESRFVFLNYILYTIISSIDKFFLKNDSDSFVFVTNCITFIGYFTILSQYIINYRISDYLSNEAISFELFYESIYKKLFKIFFLIYLLGFCAWPFYLFICGFDINIKSYFIFFVLFISSFFNLLTRVLNIYIYRHGIYRVQLLSTLIAFPVLSLLFLIDYISVIYISVLINLLSSLIFYFYTKFKINEYNILHTHL